MRCTDRYYRSLLGFVTYVVEPSNALIVSPCLWICHSCQHAVVQFDRRETIRFLVEAMIIDGDGVRTSSRVGAREEILSPDAPRSNTRDECGKGKEGGLAWSALGVTHNQYTHNVYQVPGPEVTYTLARCAIEGRRHAEDI